MKNLKPPFNDIIYHADSEWANHYETKLQARRAVMLHAINLGWPIQYCRTVFLNPKNPGAVLWLAGKDDRPLNHVESYDRFNRDYDACYAYFQRSPAYSSATDVKHELSLLIPLIENGVWKGQAGRTDRDVFLFVIKRMIEVGSDRANISGRDAALGAGVGQRTASDSLNRLVDVGYLSSTRYGRSSNIASEYKVCHTRSYYLLGGECYMSGSDTPQRHTPSNHECWVQLGKTAAAIYRVLVDESASARAIAKAAGVGNKTASRNLPILDGYGLASKTDDGWVIGPISPDTVAFIFWEGEPKNEKRKAQFKEDRRLQVVVKDHIREIESRLFDPDDTPWEDLEYISPAVDAPHLLESAELLTPESVNLLSEVAAVEDQQEEQHELTAFAGNRETPEFDNSWQDILLCPPTRIIV